MEMMFLSIYNMFVLFFFGSCFFLVLLFKGIFVVQLSFLGLTFFEKKTLPTEQMPSPPAQKKNTKHNTFQFEVFFSFFPWKVLS